MTDVFNMAVEDAGKVKSSATDEDKASIASLAEKQLSLKTEIENLEELLKEKKKDLQRVEEHDLPEAMDRIGMSEFKLTDGTKISVGSFYNASIPAERKDEAFDWLDEHGHGSIIKAAVKTEFGRGSLEGAKAFLEYARRFNQLDQEPVLDQGVHWQTLRAFVKEQVEEGAGLPLDLFGVYIGRKAKITKAKRS